MRNPVTHSARFIAPIISLMVGCSCVLITTNVRAESPDKAPSQLKNTLAQIDAAANSKNLQSVMQFYSPNFSHSDGLTRPSVEKALSELWKRYPKLTYRTELQSWEPQANGFVAETVTRIAGSQLVDGKDTKLESSVRSRQRFEGTKLVRQDILTERTQLTSGAKPPSVEIKLPQQVRSGQEYSFDAIVKEPVGDDLLLGSALEEPVQSDRYLKPSNFDLELLSSGGIFKMGKAPAKQGNYWISAVLLRSDGMTMITQRLQVLK